MGLLAALARRTWEPLLRLTVIGLIAGAIALLGWGPYLLAASKGSPADAGTAQHYLPADGARLSFPMLDVTLLGALCMVGTLWLVVAARRSTRAGALAIGVIAVYAWSLLSMLTTLLGSTLLSFRLQPTLTLLLTAAGALGFIEATVAIATRYTPATRQRVIAAGAALGAIGAMTFTQDIPNVLRPRHQRRLHGHRWHRPARRPAATGSRAVLPARSTRRLATSPESPATRPSS